MVDQGLSKHCVDDGPLNRGRKSVDAPQNPSVRAKNAQSVRSERVRLALVRFRVSLGGGGHRVDNLKIRNRVLGRLLGTITLTVSSLAAFVGCSHATIAVVPTRAPICAALVVASSDDFTARDLGRNDASLGLARDPIMRVSDQATVYTNDTQYIFNGRPYSNYSTTARSWERFSR